ncbi:MAG: threonine synthase [SAR202 cluster bacterium]|nr:threonine synthase [SAR202 cluster bacterium]
MGVGVLLRYGQYLPMTDATPRLTLGEGETPLVRSKFLERDLGIKELYFKLEGCNPTGSFKDRGIVVAVAKAKEAGHHTILCASTGNTSAAAAAYGAAAGMHCVVLVPKGNVAMGKMSQAIAYGARIVMIRGNFDRALEVARGLADEYPISLVNSVNQHRIEGQKTAAFEIVDALGDAPDHLYIPVGNAGNITAYWRGFTEYRALGKTEHAPRMMGWEAEGAAPIATGKRVDSPNTIASAIRIGNPASWQSAERARDESGGDIATVSDDEIVEAYRLLARREGIFCEPASAACVAGLMKNVRQGLDLRQSSVVCVLTGNGLKDPDIVYQVTNTPLEEATPDLEAVAKVLNLERAGSAKR